MAFSTIPHTKVPVRNDVPVERLRELFSYDPTTGNLVRIVKPWRRGLVGIPIQTKAGSNSYFSYTVSIKGKSYKVHRVIWAMQTGKWPSFEIDHINGDPFDNRWCNLREATRAQNRQNISKTARNSSGVKGVRKSNKGRTFTAEIRHNGIRQWKCFYTLEEAVEWRRNKAEEFHGEFAKEI